MDMIDSGLVEALQLTEREPGVLVCEGDIGYADQALVEGLKQYAAARPAGRARVMFHRDAADGLHEMLIAARAMTIWPPHLNEGGAKSWTVLDGAIAYVQYTPPGDIADIRHLAPAGSHAPSFFRLSAQLWHTIVPLSDMSVYLETKRGPHRQTRFADWGPQSPDDEAARELLERVQKLEP